MPRKLVLSGKICIYWPYEGWFASPRPADHNNVATPHPQTLQTLPENYFNKEAGRKWGCRFCEDDPLKWSPSFFKSIAFILSPPSLIIKINFSIKILRLVKFKNIYSPPWGLEFNDQYWGPPPVSQNPFFCSLLNYFSLKYWGCHIKINQAFPLVGDRINKLNFKNW